MKVRMCNRSVNELINMIACGELEYEKVDVQEMSVDEQILFSHMPQMPIIVVPLEKENHYRVVSNSVYLNKLMASELIRPAWRTVIQFCSCEGFSEHELNSHLEIWCGK